jgi:AraC family transcriptional regulator, regulatory protein of adaptative response / methylated-DNA-[protein]-cysteine methyltransferase
MRLARPLQAEYSCCGMLDFAAQYAALQCRDPSRDGAFFVAVKTTGIYCRRVCRVRTPLARNVAFYRSAAAAERAGYRPCLRCRPENLSRLFARHLDASPLQVAQSLRVQRAKRLLDETDLPIAVVAQRAGFSTSRRMRAAFADVYGRSPSALRMKKRSGLHIARRPAC